ncbi:IS3 family transposase [Chloroflexota bacterium]
MPTIPILALARISYGYRRLHILLQREGWQVNHKRIYWLYRLEGLGMRPKKPRRHVTARRRMERPTARKPMRAGQWISCLTHCLTDIGYGC